MTTELQIHFMNGEVLLITDARIPEEDDGAFATVIENGTGVVHLLNLDHVLRIRQVNKEET